MFSKFINQLLSIYGHIPFGIQYFLNPLILMFWIIKFKNKCKLDWLLKVLVIGSYMLVLLYGAASDISIGYYTYYLLFILFLISIIISFLKVKKTTFFIKKNLIGWSGYLLGLIVILACMYLNVNAFSACFYHEEAIELSFPFKNGMYLTTQGGDGKKSSMMNYHYLDTGNIECGYNKSMRYSNDVVKLNSIGLSINSFNLKKELFLPEDLERYEIFSEKIYSPCDGEVYYAVDGYYDVPASAHKYYGDTGNGIVIKHDDVYIMLWHLKQKSIHVKVGDKVKVGQLIGQVGNSGHTSTPHLHIQASKDDWLYGTSVPILFDGKFPIKHSLFIR